MSPTMPLYEEKQTMAFRPVILAAICAMLLFAAWQTRAQIEAAGLLLFVMVLAVVSLYGLTELHVRVFADELRFGFALFRKRIPLEKITVGSVSSIPFWAGVGIHTTGRTWVFNARFGRGLELTIGKQRYLIGSAQPERLQAALLEAQQKRTR